MHNWDSDSAKCLAEYGFRSVWCVGWVFLGEGEEEVHIQLLLMLQSNQSLNACFSPTSVLLVCDIAECNV